jgi:hypothetical protein
MAAEAWSGNRSRLPEWLAVRGRSRPNVSPIGKALAWLNAQDLVDYTGAPFEVNNWGPAGRACISVRDAGASN